MKLELELDNGTRYMLKSSRILLWGELGLLGLFILLLISYLISSAIVCRSTNGDYKGCTELKESGNNEN